jgi:hypothetical protein
MQGLPRAITPSTKPDRLPESTFTGGRTLPAGLQSRSSISERDFVECGIYHGGHSLTIVIHQFFSHSEDQKTFYLLDTFEGSVDKYTSALPRKKGVTEQLTVLRSAKETLPEFPNVRIIKEPYRLH